MTLSTPITALYAGIFGLLLLPITIRVGQRRLATGIFFLDGGDEALLRRMRSHANFLEYVPFALLLIALAEQNGAGAALLHAMGATLLVARTMHYITLNTRPLAPTRAISMAGTFLVFVAASGWLLYTSIA